MIDTLILESDLSKYDKRLRISPFDPKMYICRGMIYFKLGRLLESLQDFNKAEELNPQLTPYLWQRGITYYYLGKYSKGARQFELDLSVNSQDVEETLWYYLCIAQLENSLTAMELLFPINHDLPLFMGEIYQLFAGKLSVENLLYSLKTQNIRDLFYLNLYIGLYYEAQKDSINSFLYINQAINYKIDDYMWYLACLHNQLRRKY
ncbi:MAG: tetratricopeptide repeat protein [Cyanobacteria bacterium]|nr:tetratricopeptide repeat protein [Cyanobacteria bacterium CG_2015-16_32_12]NCO78244.1 tetratricopeptide repeat protein [Cyanobacteria bacterium CG_2015-22_32_23]NCQ03739.1 tetratricopeptide repeat protein [Cyanobacteria bacterium CG_2015-09_32_10]NCQ40612.1 tetratricopeptide repeat protein [Cyanobacteria bacterium CG_2015-04_32_10]NCS85167.1 tetratricopeptide repeat protein [Cyanobacteria bacterium CG_2015-02_32_10]